MAVPRLKFRILARPLCEKPVRLGAVHIVCTDRQPVAACFRGTPPTVVIVAFDPPLHRRQ